MILNIIHTNIKPTPKATAYIRVFIIVVPLSNGVNQSGFITACSPSKPNTEPYIKPKNIEDIPSGTRSFARKPPFFRHIINAPTRARTKPCPTSPNIIPKRTVYTTAKNGVGSSSL